MNKTILNIVIAVSIAIALGVGGYYYWSGKNKADTGAKALENATEAADKIIDSAVEGVLPSLQVNPLENKPDINPADKANPYKDIKTNPFESL